jgi:chemosensory pili system protein ChpA (sensor histidine kinase/response regulator)
VADCLQACADALEERVERMLDESLLEQLHDRIDELCDSPAQGISLGSHSLPESIPAASHPAILHESSAFAKPAEMNCEDHDTETVPPVSFESDTEVSLVNQPELMEEMREVFTEEADDHLRLIYSAFTELEQHPGRMNRIQDVRRSAHTLKGAAGSVGLHVVSKLAHRMEDLLDTLFQSQRPIESESLSLLYETADAVQDLIHGGYTIDNMQTTVRRLFERYDAVLLETEYLARDEESFAEPFDSTEPRTESLANSVDDPGTMPEEAALADDPSQLQEVVGFDDSTHPTNPAIEQFDQQTLEDDVASQETQLAEIPLETDRAPLDPARLSEFLPQLGVWNRLSEPITHVPRPNTASEVELDEEKRQRESLRVPWQRIDALMREVGELIVNRSALEQRLSSVTHCADELRRAVERLRHLSRELDAKYGVGALGGRRPLWGDGDSLVSSSRRFVASHDDEFDPLEFDRYSGFHLMSRSLAETTTDLGTISNELQTLIGDCEQLLKRQGQHSRETQNQLMRIRLVPLSSLTTQLQRIVRTVASQRGKLVTLQMDGGDLEIDKQVLSELSDPLLHLLRNAVDHGIEPADVRRQSGKPEQATIRVAATHEGTQVILKISDDGAGLNHEAIRATVIRNGLLTDEEASRLSQDELAAFIFLPGFSTASEVTEISGRGVGLDIVRDRVQKLKGTILVESQAGLGTTFTVRVPMMLGVVRALLVQAASATFALPVQSIQQIVRADRDQIEHDGDTNTIRMGEETLRLVFLHEWLHLNGMHSHTSATVPVLVVSSGNRKLALAVEKVLPGRDVVVKSLGTHLRRVQGLIGATLLGDGSVVPILDSAELVGVSTSATRPRFLRPVLQREPQAACIMVVDDSVSVRRVMANLLKGAGFDVLEAKDGLDALDQLHRAKQAPDLFLLDIEMPRMDGYELLTSLRAQAEHRETPVVMVTSRAGAKHRKKALKLGATDYLVKPYQADQLLLLIRSLLAHSPKPALASVRG